MLKNYIKIALRNIRRHAVYSFINIFGLAVGLASAIVIGLWVYQEWSYDRHFEHADRIYRVGVNFMNVGDMAVGPHQFSQYARDFPEIKQTTILKGAGLSKFFVGDREFNEKAVFKTDSNFFEVFSYSFLEGNPSSALDHPNNIVLTESVARKFFSNGSAIGKTVLIGEEKQSFTVSGVVKEEGYNSHINARIWMPLEPTDNTNWLSASVYNYVLLKEGIPEEALKNRLEELVETKVYPSLSISVPYEKWKETGGSYRFIPMPVTDIYLKSQLKFEITPGGNESNVSTFAGIALLIIVIAAINFVNITTARSSIRAKEVGIRKTLGTGRRSLVLQFIFESVFISFCSLLLAFGLAEIFLSFFERVTGIVLLETLITGVDQVLAIIGIVLFIGILAGMYPAFYLTGFKPVKVLKGQIYSREGNQGLLRNVLVFVQFAISISLLIGLGVILKQIDYMESRDLGLQTENVLIIDNAGDLGNQREVLRQKLLEQAGVEYASFNHRIPAGKSILVNSFQTAEMKQSIPMQSFWGDHTMVPTLGFRILKGRNFSSNIASDTSAVILNQSAVKALGLGDPVGAQLNNNQLKVIGVVADFNFESFRKEIEPVVLMLSKKGGRLAVKVRGKNAPNIIDRAKEIWAEIDIPKTMNYYFLDRNFEQLIQKEQILFKAMIVFAVLAMLISCLGLYGLSAYITEQKTKEIGIRRILGADFKDIILMLGKIFTKPILLAVVVSVPLSYMFMHSWLANFAYKTSIGVMVFVAGSLMALIIALVTVSGQSVKAASRNPVESLRSE